MPSLCENRNRVPFSMRKLFLFVALLLLTQITLAQLDTTNNEVFTYEPTVLKPYKGLKLDLVSWLSGNNMISFEQQTSKYLGFEVGVGLLTPAYVDPLLNLLTVNFPALNKIIGLGYSASFCPKVYWDGVYDLYIGLPV
jgi:hypothetical protein